MGPPVLGLVLDTLAAFTSTIAYIYQIDCTMLRNYLVSEKPILRRECLFLKFLLPLQPPPKKGPQGQKKLCHCLMTLKETERMPKEQKELKELKEVKSLITPKITHDNPK